MSLVQMQVAIDEYRADLERAGVRGIDLDYLLDSRVEHKACLAALEDLATKELARWLEVRAMCTPEQWAWFEVMEENERLEVRTSKRAGRELREAFKRRVLKFHKEAEERSITEREQARASKTKEPKNDWPLKDVGEVA